MPLPEARGPLPSSLIFVVLLAACSAYDAKLLDGIRPRFGSGASPGPNTGVGGDWDDAVPGGTGGQSGAGGSGGDDRDGGVEVTACGDGVVSGDERCDTAIAQGVPGACPSDCDSGDPCLPRELRGSACQARCEIGALECVDADGCCPAACSNAQDDDCSGSCGDGVIQADEGESCEVAGPDAGGAAPAPCPTECPDDGDACTVEVLTGSADNCNAACTMTVIVALDDTDGCCPEGANSTVDDDCPPECGNGVIEAGEDCDGGDDCDEQCHSTIVTDEQRCMNVFSDVTATCNECMCASCTTVTNDCFDSGDATRDADCAELVACGLANGCRGSQCYCGLEVAPDGTCLVGDGPCAALLDRIAGTPGALSVYGQQFDLTTAIGRARAFSDCHGVSCLDACP